MKPLRAMTVRQLEVKPLSQEQTEENTIHFCSWNHSETSKSLSPSAHLGAHSQVIQQTRTKASFTHTRLSADFCQPWCFVIIFCVFRKTFPVILSQHCSVFFSITAVADHIFPIFFVRTLQNIVLQREKTFILQLNSATPNLLLLWLSLRLVLFCLLVKIYFLEKSTLIPLLYIQCVLEKNPCFLFFWLPIQ